MSQSTLSLVSLLKVTNHLRLGTHSLCTGLNVDTRHTLRSISPMSLCSTVVYSRRVVIGLWQWLRLSTAGVANYSLAECSLFIGACAKKSMQCLTSSQMHMVYCGFKSIAWPHTIKISNSFTLNRQFHTYCLIQSYNLNIKTFNELYSKCFEIFCCLNFQQSTNIGHAY